MHCIEFYTLEPIFNTKKYPTSYRSNFSPTPTTYRSILTNKGPYDRSLLKCRLPGVPMFNWNSPDQNLGYTDIFLSDVQEKACPMGPIDNRLKLLYICAFNSFKPGVPFMGPKQTA